MISKKSVYSTSFYPRCLQAMTRYFHFRGNKIRHYGEIVDNKDNVDFFLGKTEKIC